MDAIRQKLDEAWRHYERGAWQEAEKLCLSVLSVDPNQFLALQTLGVIAGRTGRFQEAYAYIKAVLRLRPDWAEAHCNMGNVHAAWGNHAEAVACFEQALRLKPDFAEARCNIGHSLIQLQRLDEAVEQLERFVAYRPDHVESYVHIGNLRKEQARLDEAIAAYRRALRLRPDSALTHSSLVLALNYHPRYDHRAIRDECNVWNRIHAAPLSRFHKPHQNLPDPERRLRVGYVSPDFRSHVDMFFLFPLLTHHDHGGFEIVCYSDTASPDPITARFMSCADVWRDTAKLGDSELAELIRADRIDVLVDLKMHTGGNRLLVFARKPAPVQVSWLGYPGTTGVAAIDYRLTDPWLEPPGMFDQDPVEEAIRLPETFWCYDPLVNQPSVNDLPAATNHLLTLGSLNAFCKLNDECLNLWARVLQAVPRSRLLMLAPWGEVRKHVQASLERAGVARSRIEFVDRVPRSEYLRLYHQIDVNLDPIPYNGHTTSLDGFWMGVPTISLVGRTIAGRAGWSQLNNLGLQELAAATVEDFVDLAVRIAGDLPRLRELRATLRPRMQKSPLTDAARFASNVEQVYREIWRRWCTRQ